MVGYSARHNSIFPFKTFHICIFMTFKIKFTVANYVRAVIFSVSFHKKKFSYFQCWNFFILTKIFFVNINIFVHTCTFYINTHLHIFPYKNCCKHRLKIKCLNIK